MKIVDGHIRCGNNWELFTVEALFAPEIFYYPYLPRKVQKYYNKLLTNNELCAIIKSQREERGNKNESKRTG